MGKISVIWYKMAKIGISDEAFNRKMKEMIRTDPFFSYLFEEYGVDVSEIDSKLTFEIKKLDGKFAQSDADHIYLNEKLFEKGDFFKHNLHFAIHEITHWLTRQREKQFYFADPEEIEAFSCGIAFEILRGKKEEEIIDVFLPIIRAHFDETQNAHDLFSALFIKAVGKIRNYNK